MSALVKLALQGLQRIGGAAPPAPPAQPPPMQSTALFLGVGPNMILGVAPNRGLGVKE